jgi:hypothetical protein
MPRLARKTTTAIGVFGLLTAATHYGSIYVPRYWHTSPPPPLVSKTKPVVEPPPKIKAVKPITVPFDKLPLLADPSDNLHTFFEALERTEKREPNAVTRIIHYGDSPTTADLITADLRALLQQRFGDAGHGFVLIAKPWAWYGHRGVGIKASGWRIEAASMTRAKDRLHGLGGVSFTGNGGANSTINLPDLAHTSMNLYYLSQPSGGDLRVQCGEQALVDVTTAHEGKQQGFASVELPSGCREVRLSVTRGAVRLFGVSFEKRDPGVVYHSLGLNGASVQMLLGHFEAGHWAGQLRHANPHLVVLNYGSNESFFGDYLDGQYPRDLRQLLRRMREALPEASILVMSPMDRGDRSTNGEIVTPDALPRVIAIQRRIALEEGCAFFNTFQAMGGAGTMARWYNDKPRLVSADFLHPLPQGAAKVGALVNKSLIEGYEKWKAARP